LDGEKPSRERSQAVISDLIFASIKLGRQEDLLATLEDITGTYFESFRPSLMNEWERLLRSAENYQRELNNLEIQNRLRSDKNYADHWKAYEDFLRQVATLPLMKQRPVEDCLGSPKDNRMRKTMKSIALPSLCSTVSVPRHGPAASPSKRGDT